MHEENVKRQISFINFFVTFDLPQKNRLKFRHLIFNVNRGKKERTKFLLGLMILVRLLIGISDSRLLDFVSKNLVIDQGWRHRKQGQKISGFWSCSIIFKLKSASNQHVMDKPVGTVTLLIKI